jgi:hypothetical protein
LGLGQIGVESWGPVAEIKVRLQFEGELTRNGLLRDALLDWVYTKTLAYHLTAECRP